MSDDDHGQRAFRVITRISQHSEYLWPFGNRGRIPEYISEV